MMKSLQLDFRSLEDKQQEKKEALIEDTNNELSSEECDSDVCQESFDDSDADPDYVPVTTKRKKVDTSKVI